MELCKNVRAKATSSFNISTGGIWEQLIFILFVTSLVFLSSKSYYLYHSVAEVFSSVIGFGIFMVSFNTYKISKNDFFMFLGIGNFFVSVLDLMHTFAYGDMNIFPNGSINMVTQFWIIARFFGASTLLIGSIFVYKRISRLNYFIIVPIFVVVFGISVLSIMYFNIFPTCYIEGKGLTQFKIICEYLISSLYLIAAILLYRARKSLDKRLFLYLELSLVLKVVYELIFTMPVYPTDISAMIGHILKVISFYYMYQAIIVNGIQRPFETLVYKLDKVDNSLKEKERQHVYMEEVLAQNQQCYDLIINHSSDAIAIHSEGRVVFANATSAKMIGARDSSQLINKKVFDIVHKDYTSQINQRIKKIIENKEEVPFIEVKFLHLDGSYIDVECISRYILYRGKPAVITMFKDISSRKKIQVLESNIKENEKQLNQTKEFNRVLTEFFSNISHELKTPLNVIFGAIQVLNLPSKEELPTAFERRLNKHLSTMKQNSYRLLRLVNNLIDVSKLDSGYLRLNLRNYNVVSVIEDITLSVADYVENKGVEIIFDTDIEEKEMAIDADNIERVLLNLLSNAIKFTDKGGKIEVSIKDRFESILISVKDTGVGIPEDKFNLIFDRFGQVDKTLTRNREGSGIGLSLVKAIVEMHGGTISVSSRLGEGSEFIIELPVKIVEEEAIDSSLMSPSNVEKISIEFSDIYSYN